MHIKKIKGVHPDVLQGALWESIQRKSRFTAVVEVVGKAIKITNVRLFRKKAYCGNHPKACERLHDGPHRKGNWLEGADWVEFNDLVNDVIDAQGAEANVASSVCIIRKGALRRMNYDGNKQFGNGTWASDKDDENPDHWMNNVGGGVLVSEFPIGTPGIHSKIQYNCVG